MKLTPSSVPDVEGAREPPRAGLAGVGSLQSLTVVTPTRTYKSWSTRRAWALFDDRAVHVARGTELTEVVAASATEVVVLHDLGRLVANPSVLAFLLAPCVPVVVVRGHEFRTRRPLDRTLLALAAEMAAQRGRHSA